MGRVSWYVFRRLMVLLIGVMLILTVEFVIFRVLPEDVARVAIPYPTVDPVHYEETLEILGEPLFVQYVEFIVDMLGGDFHYDLFWNVEIEDFIYGAMWTTLTVLFASLAACLALGTLGGYMIFRMKTHVSRQVASMLPLALFAVPVLLSEYVVVQYLSYEWGLLPLGPRVDANAFPITFPIMSVAVISFTLVGAFTLIVRDGLMTASAASRPDPPRLRDALFAAMPKMQFMVAGLMFFVATAEVMFNSAGLGRYFFIAIFNMEYFLLQATFFLMAMIVFVTNFAMETVVTLVRPNRRFDMYLREDAPVTRTWAQPQPRRAALTSDAVKGALAGIARDYIKSPVGVVALVALAGLVVLAVVGPVLPSDDMSNWDEPSSWDMFLDGATGLVKASFIVGLLASLIGMALGTASGLARPYLDPFITAAAQGQMAIPILCLMTVPIFTVTYQLGCVDVALLISLLTASLVTMLVSHGVVTSRRRPSASVGDTAGEVGPWGLVPAVVSSTLSGLKYGLPMTVMAVFTLDFFGLTRCSSWGYAFEEAVHSFYSGTTYWEWLLPAVATCFLVGSVFLVLDTLERIVRTRYASLL